MPTGNNKRLLLHTCFTLLLSFLFQSNNTGLFLMRLTRHFWHIDENYLRKWYVFVMMVVMLGFKIALGLEGADFKFGSVYSVIRRYC